MILATDTRQRLKFSALRYEQMITAGVLTERDPVELLSGEIVEMAPIGPSHAAFTTVLNRRLVMGLLDRAWVQVQSSVWLDEYSMPEPDFAILKSRSDNYLSQRPTPTDIYALIEVSDSTLVFDRTVKLALYAKAGIEDYWIVDVQGKRILVHRQPEGDCYRDCQEYNGGSAIALLAFPAIAFDVESLLP